MSKPTPPVEPREVNDIMDDLDERDLLEAVDAIARRHGTTTPEFIGDRSQTPHLLAARRDVYQHLKDMGWSAAAIGRLFGRHHTTVQSAMARGLTLHCGRRDSGCVRAGQKCACQCSTCLEAALAAGEVSHAS